MNIWEIILALLVATVCLAALLVMSCACLGALMHKSIDNDTFTDDPS